MKESDTQTSRPPYRYELRGKIISEGHSSLAQFAHNIGISASLMYRIVNGWWYPSPELQQRFANALGLRLKELKKLLED